jgi:hypothetical protein
MPAELLVGDITDKTPEIRILFLSANPSDTAKIAFDREVRDITQHLRATPHGNRFVCVQEPAVRVVDLQAALHRHAPHILHFSGHGRNARMAASDPAARVHRDVDQAGDKHEPAAPAGSEILVEDHTGAAMGISTAALTDLLRLVGCVRGVVLNACYAAAQCHVLRKQADWVIGMARAIPDRAAIAFAWAFYQALGFGKSVEKAFAFGRNQIALERLPGADLPRLFRRDEKILARP